MNSELVSVVVPCYNVESYIRRFFRSLLSQTYKKLEVILVNDGSTDSTGEVIKEYIPMLENAGFKVIYIEQANGGLAAAINTGIKHVHGGFLTWPDPDDWLTPDSIEKRVLFLQQHPDAAMVRCNIEKIQEGSENSLGVYEPALKHPVVIENFYENLRDIKTWFGSLACLVRMSCFDEVNPEHDIYVHSRGGQNLQMLLPIAKKYPCWQMPDVLGYYLIRNKSHSNIQNNLEAHINYVNATEQVVLNTLIRMSAEPITLHRIKQQYAWKRILIAKRRGSLLDILSHVTRAWPVVNEKWILLLAPITPRFIFRFIKKI